MKLKLPFAILALLMLGQTSMAKEWRGIVPLKSTRADVERLFGKPDEWGDYQVKDERVSFEYSDGPCKGLNLTLGLNNCKCLVDKDTVMSIFVEPTVKWKISDLKLDMKKFRRTPINPFPHTFEYYNATEGIVYTVDEPADEITTITYYPSPVDCQEIIRQRAPRYRNSWSGLVPLHSSRADVERVLGPPTESCKQACDYDTKTEGVFVLYSDERCASGDSGALNVPPNTVISVTIYPAVKPKLKDLKLDMRKFTRTKDPELHGYSTYTNAEVGVTYEVSDKNTVLSIEWFGSCQDIQAFRCPSRP